MKGYVWIERPNGQMERYGPYRVNSRNPNRVADLFMEHDPLSSEAWGGVAGGLTPADRITIGDEVFKPTDFGQWESVASGPAGSGFIGAMEDML